MDGWTLAPSSTSGGRPKLDTYRPVSIPGTFQDVLGSGFEGVVWYRLSLNLNKAWEGSRVRLEFDGAATDATVFINGELVAHHLGAWTPFTADLTHHLCFDGTDYVEVRLDQKVGHNTQGFLPVISPHFGGIWQPVHLTISNEPRLDDRALTVFTDGGEGRITVNAPRLDTDYIPMNTRVQVYANQTKIVVEEIAEESVVIFIPEPQLWSPDEPFQYRLLVELVEKKTNKVIDNLELFIGMRMLESDGDIIRLNRKPLLIRGVLDWGYRPPHFAPYLSKEDWVNQFREVKTMGFNLVKVCLWVPPSSFYEAADETGILIWQEYPTWHAQIDEEHMSELIEEFDEFFLHDGSHVSVILRSLTCESGRDHADPKVLGKLFQACHESISQTMVIDDSSWIDWSHHHDFYDDHAYTHNSIWRKRLFDFRCHIYDNDEQEIQPFLLGEAITGDTWRDSTAFNAHNLNEDTKSWYSPAVHNDANRFEFWATERFGYECVSKLLPDSLAYVHANRKYQIERLALDMPPAGFVCSVWRDIPRASMGFVDYAGQRKWSAKDFFWLGDTMVLLDDKEDRRAFYPGDSTNIRVRHFGCGSLQGNLVITMDGIPISTIPDIHLNSGESSCPFPVILPRDPVDNPSIKILETRLEGTHLTHNKWRLWLLPRAATTNGFVRKVAELDKKTLSFIKDGGAALITVNGAIEGYHLHKPFFDAGGPFVPYHPIHEWVPAQMLKDLLAFDFERIPIMCVKHLRDQIEPIVSRWDTHDLECVNEYSHAFTAKIGKGRILVTSLNLDSIAGRWLETVFMDYLERGPAPKTVLTWPPF